MAACTFHARSNSLPSRPHPLISEFDEHFCRIKDSQAASTSSSLNHKLSGLQDLHDCVDNLLLLPLNQQGLVRDLHRKLVDELLDESLRLLDLCNSAKDILTQTKECVSELQSVIRRRIGDLDNQIRKYLTCRKVVRKAIKKALKNTVKKRSLSSVNEVPEIVFRIKEAEAIALAVLESLLLFISDSKSQSKQSGWSLVSKLAHHKKVSCSGDETNANEFAMADAALESLIGCKTKKCDNIKLVDNVQKKLNSLELCIQDLEEGTESLFRHMIKTRASFLNIFC